MFGAGLGALLFFLFETGLRGEKAPKEEPKARFRFNQDRSGFSYESWETPLTATAGPR